MMLIVSLTLLILCGCFFFYNRRMDVLLREIKRLNDVVRSENVRVEEKLNKFYGDYSEGNAGMDARICSIHNILTKPPEAEKSNSPKGSKGTLVAKSPFKKSISDEHRKKISDANKLRWVERKKREEAKNAEPPQATA